MTNQINSLISVLTEEDTIYSELVEEYLEELAKREFTHKIQTIVRDLLPKLVREPEVIE